MSASGRYRSRFCINALPLVGDQASRLQLLLFLTAAIKLSFRLSNSLVRLSDSFAESLIRGGPFDLELF